MAKTNTKLTCLSRRRPPRLSSAAPFLQHPAARPGGSTGRLPTTAGSRGLELPAPTRAPGAADRGIPAPAAAPAVIFVVLRIPTPGAGGTFGVVRLPAPGAGYPVLHPHRAHPVARADGCSSEGDPRGHAAAAAAVAAYPRTLHGAAPHLQLDPTE